MCVHTLPIALPILSLVQPPSLSVLPALRDDTRHERLVVLACCHRLNLHGGAQVLRDKCKLAGFQATVLAMLLLSAPRHALQTTPAAGPEL